MSLLDNLPDLCTIGRQTFRKDAYGGSIYGIEIEQTDVECWLQPASDSEAQLYEKRSQAVTNKVYFASNPSLTEQHLILVTERSGVLQSNLDITDVDNPDTLKVESVSQPDASVGLGILWRAMCNNGTGPTQ